MHFIWRIFHKYYEQYVPQVSQKYINIGSKTQIYEIQIAVCNLGSN